MCGISGIISRSGLSEQARKAGHILRHRGPDAEGHWEGQVAGTHVMLHQNRLSIIDLAERSNQPFWSEDGRFGLIYNGEIFNYVELRDELIRQGVTFRTQSDTEVILELLRRLPPEEALNKLNGMWAFALLDKEKGTILFARDRLGKKPMYVHRRGDAIYFGSEIKFILEATGAKFKPNPSAVARHLQQYLLDSEPDQTFFEGLHQLPAAHWTTVDLRKMEWSPRRYYEVPDERREEKFGDSVERLRELLLDSVKIRLRSDVKVGLLLSGGVDSSALAAAAVKQSSGNLEFLSVVSDDPRYDESKYIKAVERHLDIKVHTIDVSSEARSLFAGFEKATWHNDEPLISLGALTYMRMMDRAREHGVTVLLTGQGADEIFCGYKKFLGFRLQQLASKGQYFKAASVLAGFLRTRCLINEIHLGEVKRYWGPRSKFNILGSSLKALQQPSIGLGGCLRKRQKADITSFSVPALLHYEDRLSMARGREVRVPFLDYRLVEFGLGLPADSKIGGGWSKRVLREAIAPWLPPEVTWRKDKRGFTVPQEQWMRNELRPDVEAMLNGSSPIFDFGLVDREALKAKYEIYTSNTAAGRRMSYKEIFAPLALNAWLKTFAGSLERA